MKFKKSLIAVSIIGATLLSGAESANASDLNSYVNRTTQQIGVGVQHANYSANRAYYKAQRTIKREYNARSNNFGSGGIVIIK